MKERLQKIREEAIEKIQYSENLEKLNEIKVAILGYGNIGRAAEQAVLSAPDMTLAGVYHHNDCLDGVDADVMVICTPTREVQKFATLLSARGICTVDSFDVQWSGECCLCRLGPRYR